MIFDKFKIFFNKFNDYKLLNQAFSHSQNNNFDKAKIITKKIIFSKLDPKNNKIDKILPKYIQLETVRTCNAACIMCPLETSPTPKIAMSDKTFLKILFELQKLNNPLPAIGFHGLNEPLMDKKIFKRIQMLKDIGIAHLDVVSNGALMNEKKAEKLINLEISAISFSIESIKKDEYERIRKKLVFEDTIRGIKSFVKKRNELKSNIPIRILFTYTRNTASNYFEFKKFWKKILSKKLDEINLIPMHSFGKFEINNSKNNNPCYQLFTDMHIRANGNVSMCCIDVESDYGYGNINENSIKEIYNSELINKDRFKHLDNKRFKIKICDECDQPESAQLVQRDNFDNNFSIEKFEETNKKLSSNNQII